MEELPFELRRAGRQLRHKGRGERADAVASLRIVWGSFVGGELGLPSAKYRHPNDALKPLMGDRDVRRIGVRFVGSVFGADDAEVVPPFRFRADCAGLKNSLWRRTER